jgi:hypothetical protein
MSGNKATYRSMFDPDVRWCGRRGSSVRALMEQLYRGQVACDLAQFRTRSLIFSAPTTAAGSGTQTWQVRYRRQFRKLGSMRSSFRNRAGHASLSAIVDISPRCVSAAFFSITAGAVGCGVPPSVNVRTCIVHARSRRYIRRKASATDRPTVNVP